MKLTKRIVSLALVLAIVLSVVPMTVSAEQADSGKTVAVDVATAGGSMNLTETGSTDWIHFTSEQVNRKASEEYLTAYEQWEKDLAAWKENMAGKAEVIDYMSTSGDTGRTFGQTRDQVWRFQTFQPAVSGKLTTLKVALIKKGTPSALIAKLYKVNNIGASDVTELASVTVPADEIPGNEEFALNFGDVELEAGVTYAVAMTQETLDNGNLYHWCTADNPGVNGKITNAEGTAWTAETTAAALYVEIGDVGTKPVAPTVATAGIIGFETIGEKTKMDSTMNDSVVSYSWSDGAPTRSANGSKLGGVINYNKGVRDDEIPAGNGWKITVPADNSIQTLTFVSGVWNSSGKISILVNGETVYSNTELTAGGTSVVKTYTVTVSPNVAVEVLYEITAEGSMWGNSSLGGVTLSRTEPDESTDYVALLRKKTEEAELWIGLDGIEEYFKTQIENAQANALAALAKGAALSSAEAYTHYVILDNAIKAAKNSFSSGNFANSTGMVSSFGWEGDKDAPIAWIDGTYRLRDNGNQLVTFGVSNLEPNSVDWHNAEGYLPCFVSEYDKDSLHVKIENFADEVYVNGNRYEIAYSRMSVTNNGENSALLPIVSDNLVALNEAAASVNFVEPGQTVVRDYCIGADRFGGSYAYPTNAELAEQGSFDEHYAHMKNYWNTRLEGIVDIQSVPAQYAELINAYKAGYIYMLIISDGYELHVGENGYDRVFDHDVIGMLCSLVMSGHTEHFADYAQYILLNVQYPDARWKYSWPFALYLQKTGDAETVLSFWSDLKSNTHNIADCREVCQIAGYGNVKTASGEIARIMKRTDAIDSYGYWTIDNWASLFGLTTYAYICDQLYALYGTEEYKTERDWAKAEYTSLMESTEAVLEKTKTDYGFDYIPISMVVPNELSARKDVRDGNWAAHYLFGRWDWDGYLFGADQSSWMHEYVDQTYDYIIAQKSTVFDSIYNMGGYPHGYYSSAYNAGYFSAALSGESYRDGGIEAYLWMIEHAQGGPFGWWEGVAYPDESNNLWNIDSSNGGGGSCQHMWGQSTATKVLIDSFFAEKADGTVIAGRGLPMAFNADGEHVAISGFLCNGGKKIGFDMTTNGTTVTFKLTGDALENAVSLELLALKNNIASVSDESCTVDAANGTILMPAGVTEITIELKSGVEEAIERAEAVAAGNKALTNAEQVEKELYVTSTVKALDEAVQTLRTAIESGTNEEIYAAISEVETAIKDLVDLKTYEIFYDTITGHTPRADYSFGEKDDERIRYTTFKTGNTDITFDRMIFDLGGSDLNGDALISIYTLGEDHKTLGEALTTIRVSPEDVKTGLDVLDTETPITLKANTYYAFHFDMDHTGDAYCSWTFNTTNDMDMTGLYHIKIQGNGNIVDETFLGGAMVQMSTMVVNKTALDAAVESYENKSDDAYLAAVDVLLNREATQTEVDEALEALTTLAKVREVEARINEIGEVTAEKGEAIKAAREAYSDLTEKEKTLVSNYADLVNAEHTYALLIAEAAKADAEAAKAAAEAAQKAAEDARKAAEEAAESAAEDRAAAEEAAKKAEDAQKAAEDALKSAEEAQKAAELAQKAAEEADANAAESAAAAAASAAKAAELYKEIAAMKAEMSNALAESIKAAELAQKAALESAKYYALFALSEKISAVDTNGFDAAQTKTLNSAIAAAKEAIAAAKTPEEAEAAVAAFEEAIAGIETACPAAKFNDVALDAWYHEGVDYVLSKGYMIGVSDNTFAPESNVTRAQIITILYRVAGSPDVSGMNNPFEDVPADAWFANAVIWAANKGIVTGVSATSFAPDEDLTREQLVAMLFRYSGEEKPAEDALSGYADADTVSAYAKDAMNWAISSGIINGVGANKLAPSDTAQRAQIAAIIMRYLEK